MSNRTNAAIFNRTNPEAATYLRVSSIKQTHTAIDIDADGNSIATQREECDSKVRSIEAPLSKEFIEPGKSAQSIEKRPVFRELLAYLKDHSEVGYLVVYSRSRAFRNAIDAAITKRTLDLLGVRLISCKEDFGTGYMADAMETVSDVFNELQVRQSGEDMKQKLRHKALSGGTIGRAKLGYLNIRAEQDGRLFNSSGLDGIRAPLVRKVFELYSTGDYTIERLAAAATDLGLTTRPSARSPREQPVGTSKLHQLLSDPYYAGWVTFQGQLIRGRHEAIITQQLFDQVQDVLLRRSARGQRDRVLFHYLKGMLWCERCCQAGRQSRLIYTEAKGRNGQYHSYYLCRGKQEGVCTLPHLAVWQVEAAVEGAYGRLRLPDGFHADVVRQVEAVVADQTRLTREVQDKLHRQLRRIEQREQRLIDLAADGLLDRSKILERSNAIQGERVRVQASLNETNSELELGAERLKQCLALAADPATLYLEATDETRRQLNETFYDQFFLDEDPIAVAHDVLKQPFDEIRDAGWAYARQKELAGWAARTSDSCLCGRGRRNAGQRAGVSEDDPSSVLADVFPVRVSSKAVLVEPRGFEPLTFSLRTRRSTN